jgi:heme/copper-type cytochrome/quinol oxidase subunit 2
LGFTLAGFYADDVVAVDLEVAAHLQDFADAGAREAAFIHNSTVSFIVIIYTFLGILIVLKFKQRESNTEQANKY